MIVTRCTEPSDFKGNVRVVLFEGCCMSEIPITKNVDLNELTRVIADYLLKKRNEYLESFRVEITEPEY